MNERKPAAMANQLARGFRTKSDLALKCNPSEATALSGAGAWRVQPFQAGPTHRPNYSGLRTLLAGFIRCTDYRSREAPTAIGITHHKTGAVVLR